MPTLTFTEYEHIQKLVQSISDTAREINETAGFGVGGTDAEVEQIAERFARLDDDHQAKFFCAVARIAEGWQDRNPNGLGPWFHWHGVGRHLRDCECSTDPGREMVRLIASAMETE